MSYEPRLRTKYKAEIVPKLMEQFQYKSAMQVPRLLKIAINQGVGNATQDKKLVENACLLYTSPSPRDQRGSRMPSSA